MEIRLEAAEGCKMPVGSFVAVKLGDVLKQGRYEPTRTYQFAQADKRRHAKIDLFKHVGSSVVLVSPDAGANVSEVCIQSGDPLVENLRLKVDVKPHSGAKNKVAEPVKHAVRSNAQTYLSKHGIEEKISSCVKLLLQQQPDNPIEFICCQLRGTPYPPPPVTVATPVEEHLQASCPTAVPNTPSRSVEDAACQWEEPARGLLAGSSKGSETDLSTQVPACQLDGAVRIEAEPSAAVAQGADGAPRVEAEPSAMVAEAADEPFDMRTRIQVRDLLQKACCDGSLLKVLRAAGTFSPEPETTVEAEASDSPVVATQKILAKASLDGSLVQALRRGSSNQANVGGEESAADADLACTVRQALSEASRDGRLLKALQEMDPVAPSKMSVADVQQADAPGGYDLGALRMNLTNDFMQASKDGRLETLLTEMQHEGRKPQAPSKDVHCNAASDTGLSDDGA